MAKLINTIFIGNVVIMVISKLIFFHPRRKTIQINEILTDETKKNFVKLTGQSGKVFL
jgi:hypothetical protein